MSLISHRCHIAAGVLIAVALTLSGCSGKEPPGASPGADVGSSKLMTTTPAAKGPVGKVTWNLGEGEPYTVDPYTSADYKENTVTSNMCETLLLIKPNLSIGPNLATAWNYSDPKTLVLSLRTDATFWDGTPMTSDDVAYSMNRNRTDLGSYYNYLYGRVASVTATAADQVTVKFTEPDYLFVNELAAYAGVVVQKRFYEAHPKDVGTPRVGVMCTGPFKFDSWKQGSEIRLTKYDGYWDTKRKPRVNELMFIFLTDDAAIVNGLISGQIDGTYDPPLGATGQLKQTSAGKLYLGEHASNATMIYTNPKGAMANPDLRKALQLAVDWDGIAKSVFKGTGSPIKAMFPPSIFSYGQKTFQKAYDALPEVKSADYSAAKKFVAAAENAADKNVVLAVPAYSTTQQFGNSVVDAAKRIGMKLTLKVVPTDQYTNYLYDSKTRAGVDILYTDYYPNVPDPLDWLSSVATTGGSFNPYGYSGIDGLYEKARSEADPNARAAIVAKAMTQTATELLPMTPGIYHSSRLWMRKGLTGAPASFDYVYAPWAATLGSSS